MNTMKDSIKGISPETALKMAEMLKVAETSARQFHSEIFKTYRALKAYASEVSDMLHKVALGIPITSREQHLFLQVRINMVYNNVMERYKKACTVNVQDIHLISDNIFVCEYKKRFYWIDVNGHCNLADIKNYSEISKGLFKELMKSRTYAMGRQEHLIEIYYFPEHVCTTNYKDGFTKKDYDLLSEALSLPKSIKIKYK